LFLTTKPIKNMSKFRTAATAPGVTPGDTVNLAGGEAFTQNVDLELCSLLFTSLLKDGFYRTETETCARLRHLLSQVPAEFAAKAVILARHRFGMRSVSHYAAVALSPYLDGLPFARAFFRNVVRRPDDVCEILGAHFALHGRAIPKRMKRGLGDALHRFDAYPLAKYRQEQSNLKLVDSVNLCHPRGSEPLGSLVKGTLAAPETWEVELTRAGSESAKKAATWRGLLTERKLGYMALLRNVRNILLADETLVDELCAQLQNEAAIKKSLIFPFRFLTAILTLERQVTNLPSGPVRKTLAAVSHATDLALSNVPRFEGETLVVLDESGSMTTQTANAGPGDKNRLTVAQVGVLFASVLAKANNADLMTFSDGARYRHYNPDEPTLTIAGKITFTSGGTNFPCIFQTANRPYDRIVILSDMQGWADNSPPVLRVSPMGWVMAPAGNPASAFHAYRQKFRCDPKVFSFDLAGYGTLMFPERNVYALAGFAGDAVFNLMTLFEGGLDAVRQTVNGVAL
jgi:60 kDa SS-A/Ro ribonucleoprotein